MAAETTYEVNAKLQLQGKFEMQMRRASKSIDPVQRKMMKLTRTVQRFGRAIQGAGLHLGQFAKMGAAAGGVAAAGGMAGLITGGFRYNKVQEDTINNLATMNAFYKVGDNYVKDTSDKAALFAANIGIAGTMWQELLKRQKDTPAGVAQLAQVMGGAMAGIAQTNTGLDEQLDLMTSLSLLGPSLANDYKQIGADTMRILTGGAGQDVLTFRLMRNELFDAVKSSGKLGKNLKNNDRFVKDFNIKLNETQKFNFMKKAMETLGPEYKKMFGESMSGLTSSSKSNMAQIAGAFTTPMYLGFRNFLKRANMDEGGLFNPKSLEKLIGIAAYFGNVIGGVFNKFLASFETVMAKARDGWSSLTDGFLLMWDTAIVMLKLAIVTSLGRTAAGMFVQAIGKSMSAFGSAKGAISKAGGGIVGIGKLLPKLLGLGALAVAASAVAVIVAGMAAYLVENWRKLARDILAGWDKVSEGILKVWRAAMQLWGALTIVGEAFLGTKNGADMATVSLGIVEGFLRGLGHFVRIIAVGMRVLNLVVGVFRAIIGRMLTDSAELMGNFGMGKTGLATMLREAGQGFNAAARANGDSAKQWDAAIKKLDAMLDRELTPRETADAKKAIDTLEAWLKKRLASKAPTSGVNINNQYNQWDLRNTDPDRIMSAFVPKLEAMADQRTQSYEALDQGI